MGHFEVHTQERSVLHLCTKFEAGRSIYSKVRRGVPLQILEIWSRDPVTANYGSFYGPYAAGVCPPCLYQI